MDIVFFDLETTGTDVCLDRIVSIGAQKFNSEWEPIGDRRNMLLNPEMAIPEAATAIHGITNDMVKDKPVFFNIAKALNEYLSGCAIAGHNIINFDILILAEAFARVNITFPMPGVVLLDTYRIMCEKEPRTLEGALKFYCGEDHLEAHDAGADVEAAWKVFKGQVNRYPDLRELSLEELSKLCVGENSVDLAGNLAKDADGDIIFNFGKWKGHKLKKQSNYCEWMLGASFPSDTKKIIRAVLNGLPWKN